MRKILVILGPTATGKTDLALSLAKKFNGELVSCDSRQVYKGLDIGTGKLPGNEKWEVRRGKGFWEIDGIKIWMYDVLDPKKQYTVYDYVKDANRVVREVTERGKLLILVGGTGLYLKALLEGLSNLAISVDLKLRKQLLRLSLEELQERLQKLSPKRWGKMNQSDRQNPRRLVRAIELEISPRRSPYGHLRRGYTQRGGIASHNVLKIGLTAPRQILYQRADEWVVDKIKHGMINEANELHKDGLSFDRMRQLGLIYKLLADFLMGKVTSKDTLIKTLQNQMHAYIRRQLTWFKREIDVFWFDIADKHFPENVENMVSRWYDQSHVTKN